MKDFKIQKRITPRESLSLDKYLQEIKKEELLTKAEEIFLAKKAREGNQKALDKLTKANLRFVVSVAKQYQNNGLELVDLISEGNVGLIEAAKRFNENQGFRFISYAVFYIRGYILRALSEKGRTIRLPDSQSKIFSAIKKAQNNFEQTHSRDSSPEELLETLNLSLDQILDNIYFSKKVYSLDENLSSSEEDAVSLLDFYVSKDQVFPDDGLIKESSSFLVSSVLKKLHWTDRDILLRYFGFPPFQKMSIKEISEDLDLTINKVRLALSKSQRKFRRLWVSQKIVNKEV